MDLGKQTDELNNCDRCKTGIATLELVNNRKRTPLKEYKKRREEYSLRCIKCIYLEFPATTEEQINAMKELYPDYKSQDLFEDATRIEVSGNNRFPRPKA